MKPRIPAQLTQHATTILSRRGTLQMLAATFIAGATQQRPATTAGKNRKGSRGGKKGPRRNLCEEQRNQCLSVVAEICANLSVKRLAVDPAPGEECRTTFGTCCDSFAVCDAATSLTCLSQRKVAA